MNANELRIGITLNYFGRPKTINNYSELLACFSSNGIIEVGIEPIPLTEEWLVRFGLLGIRISSTKKNYWDKEKDFSIDVEFTFVNDELLYFYVLCQNRRRNIQYVHQLQNLYFALTGEELTLNKNK